MINSRNPLRAVSLGLCAGLALLAASVSVAVASTPTPHFQPESYKAFQAQLNAGRVHAATFNKKAHTLHLLLEGDRHVLVSYPSHDERQLATQLRAHGASVKVKQSKVKVVHHKLRYVAIGVLILVVLFVGGVLRSDRRRRPPAEPDDERASRRRPSSEQSPATLPPAPAE